MHLVPITMDRVSEWMLPPSSLSYETEQLC
jgi:hypothetical protein